MNLNELILLVGVSAICYYTGYTFIAMGVIGITVLSVLFDAAFAKQTTEKTASAGGVTVKGARTEEPIVIETKKNAPFKVQEDMRIKMNPEWQSRAWPEAGMRNMYERGVSGMGIFAGMLDKIFRGKGR